MRSHLQAHSRALRWLPAAAQPQGAPACQPHSRRHVHSGAVSLQQEAPATAHLAPHEQLGWRATAAETPGPGSEARDLSRSTALDGRNSTMRSRSKLSQVSRFLFQACAKPAEALIADMAAYQEELQQAKEELEARGTIEPLLDRDIMRHYVACEASILERASALGCIVFSRVGSMRSSHAGCPHPALYPP